jgi:hypothetical protein
VAFAWGFTPDDRDAYVTDVRVDALSGAQRLIASGETSTSLPGERNTRMSSSISGRVLAVAAFDSDPSRENSFSETIMRFP